MRKARHPFLLSRAVFRCEYCRTPAKIVSTQVHVEHVIPKQHGGGNGDDNLAIACANCNGLKGPNIAGFDPDTGLMTRLFNPRRDAWSEHFKVDGYFIHGRTDVGRVTVALLSFNAPDLVLARRYLHDLGHDFE